MKDFPHHYRVNASGMPDGDIDIVGDGLDAIPTAPPPEFGGPGDRWSPESLLVAAVADCFILTFRAIARGSKFPWLEIHCDVAGTLDRVERISRFTHFDLRATLKVPQGTDESKAKRLLEKAEAGCLITNSLSSEISLHCDIEASD